MRRKELRKGCENKDNNKDTIIGKMCRGGKIEDTDETSGLKGDEIEEYRNID